MKRGLILASLFGVAAAVVLLLMPDPWAKASRMARQDAADLRAVLPQSDLLGVRVAEDDAVLQVAFWDEAGEVLYPLPNDFSPLKRELEFSELADIAAFRAEGQAAGWTGFDLDERQLLYCQSEPAACLVYDRAALAAHLGVVSLGAGPALSWRILIEALLGMAALGALVWRRMPKPEASGFELFPEQFCARWDGTDIRLSKRDTKILALLQARGGAVVTRDELYDEGWGRDYMPNSRALDQHIINLRRKLDPDKNRPELIETVRGIGYRFVT